MPATKKAFPNSPPPGASLKAMQRYVSAFKAPRAENRKLLAVIVVLAVAVMLQSFGIWHMLPLRQRIPYFVTVDSSTGAVAASNQAAQQFEPSQANEKYFLAQWITNLLTIDGGTRDRLPDSYAMLRGAALTEWQSFTFNNYQALDRLRKNPDLRVYPTIVAIGFIGEDSAAIRVALHDAQGNNVKYLLITVKFAILPPQTDAEVYRNPIGLWITHFEVTDEALQQ